MNPLVSIIIPVYNVENYLKKCLDSLLKQTLKEIEVICINDGSTDRSAEILDHYAKKDNRIRVFHQNNQGPSVARNLGLMQVQSPYISFVDSDDWVEKETFEVAFKHMREDIDFMAWGFSVWVNHHESLTKKKQFRPISSTAEQYLTPIKKRDLSNVIWSKLYRTDIIKRNQLFFPTFIRQFEDFVFNAKYFAWSKKGMFLDRYLYNSRSDREGSIMTAFSKSIKPSVYKIAFQAFEEVEKYYRENALLEENQAYLSELLATSLGSGLWFSSDKEAFLKEAQEFVKRFNLPDTDRNTFKDLLSDKGYARFDPVPFKENIFSIRNIGTKKVLRLFGIDFAFDRKKR